MRTVDIDGLPVGDGHPPRVMGVLNMSPESNYDPSVAGEPTDAVELAEQMDANGADIIDVGLQSANPKNEWLEPSVERDRLTKALAVLDAADVDARWSLETRYAEVAEAGVNGGFDVVNDVCGFADEAMKPTCEALDVPVIKMASPPDVTKPGHLKTIDDVFEALARDGFTEKTLVDPAFGEWYAEKTYEDNWEMFRRMREFRAFGRPIVTATNREDFLGDIAGRPDTGDQLAVSLAAATMEVERGAHVVRTHDVPETHDVVQVAHFLGDERVVGDDPRVVELRNLSGRELERHRAVGDAAGETAPGEGTTLAFQVGDLSPAAADALAATADAHGLVYVGGDEALISGTVAAFEAALEELAEGPAPLGEVAGHVRRATTRRV
jgi:dihydropteroate synthase